MSRPRVLYLGLGHLGLVQARIAPFLSEVEAFLVTTEPVAGEALQGLPGLVHHRLPREALRRVPALGAADYALELLDLVVRRFRPDLVHVHYVAPHDALALLPVRHVPLVLSVMGADVLEDQVALTPPLRAALRALFRRAAAVTAKSEFLAARCRDLGAPAERVHLVRWGVDRARFAPGDPGAARAALGLSPRARVLLSSRALAPLYNHLALLEAAAAVRPGLDRPLVLVFTRAHADAAHAAAVEARARALGLDARFLPPQPPDAMPRLYAAADVVASLPASDGLPQTALEALACARPVLALDLEAYAELPFAPDAFARVRHSGGVPDAADLRRALGELLAGGERPGLAAAQAWIAAEADLGASVARVRALYAQVLPPRVKGTS